MTTLKRLLTFYFIDLLILSVILVGFYGRSLLWFNERGYWLFPLLFVLLGQALGFLTFLFFENNKKKSQVFFVCAIIASVSFTLLSFKIQYSKWKHQRDYGNVDWNEFYIKYLDDNYKEVIRLAFDSLSNRMNDPNSFKLTNTSVSHRDTSLNGAGETVYSVQLFYEKKNVQEPLSANISVLQNAAYLVYFDKPITYEDQRKNDSTREKLINNLKNEIGSMPDSLKHALRKEFKDVLER